MNFQQRRVELEARLAVSQARQDEVAADALKPEPSEDLHAAINAVAVARAHLQAVDVEERRHTATLLAEQEAEERRQRSQDASTVRTLLTEREQAAAELDELLPIVGALVSRIFERGSSAQVLISRWAAGQSRSQELVGNVASILGETAFRNVIERMVLKLAGSGDLLRGNTGSASTLHEMATTRHAQLGSFLASRLPKFTEGS